MIGYEFLPYFDPKIGSIVVKQSGDWWVSVSPMIYNDRVLLWSEEDYPVGYHAGWCYDKGGAAMAAAMIWDPTVDWEPPGYKKAAAKRRLA